MNKLPEAFLTRMEKTLGDDFPAFLQSYENPPSRALRVNTIKIGPDAFKEISPWKLKPLSCFSDGFMLDENAPGLGNHPYHIAGLFYMQEPSAMAPVAALAPQEGSRVLDLCAAPGGKAGAIAARIGSGGLLVASEIVPARAKTLLQNLQRMGADNAVVTCARPETLCAAFPSYFDAVLVDAPCSGEGMFRKDEGAVREWSPAHVLSCAQRQSAILACAAQTLRGGGRLVYSTCTFSQEENEKVVDDFLASHPAFSQKEAAHLYPHETLGEGQFYALLQKEGQSEQACPQKQAKRKGAPGKELESAAYALRELFPSFPAEGLRLLADGRIFLLPKHDALLPEGLRILCAGVEVGELIKGRFAPSHALFQYCGQSCESRLSLSPDDPRLLAFLRGEVIAAEGRGYTAVLADGYPLGFGKASEGMLKNHFPKGLRLHI